MTVLELKQILQNVDDNCYIELVGTKTLPLEERDPSDPDYSFSCEGFNLKRVCKNHNGKIQLQFDMEKPLTQKDYQETSKEYNSYIDETKNLTLEECLEVIDNPNINFELANAIINNCNKRGEVKFIVKQKKLDKLFNRGLVMFVAIPFLIMFLIRVKHNLISDCFVTILCVTAAIVLITTVVKLNKLIKQ
jgi:hypothetical protein